MSEKRPGVIVVSRTFIVERGKVLAMQRAATDRNDPFQWEAPGGKLEEEQGLDETLAREIREETGLVIQPIDTIVHYESGRLRGGRYDGMHRLILFGISRVIGGKLRLSEEHDDRRWCHHKEFMRLQLTEATRNAATALQQQLKAAGLR